MNPAILLLIWLLSQLLSRMRILFSWAEAMGAKQKAHITTARMLKRKIFRMCILFLLLVLRARFLQREIFPGRPPVDAGFTFPGGFRQGFSVQVLQDRLNENVECRNRKRTSSGIGG